MDIFYVVSLQNNSSRNVVGSYEGGRIEHTETQMPTINSVPKQSIHQVKKVNSEECTTQGCSTSGAPSTVSSIDKDLRGAKLGLVCQEAATEGSLSPQLKPPAEVNKFDIMSCLIDAASIVYDARAKSNSFAREHPGFKVVKLKKIIKAQGPTPHLKPLQIEYVISHPVQYLNWLQDYLSESRRINRAHHYTPTINGSHGEYTNSDDVFILPMHFLSHFAFDSFFGALIRRFISMDPISSFGIGDMHDPICVSQINGANGEYTGKDDVKEAKKRPTEKVKFTAKGKNKKPVASSSRQPTHKQNGRSVVKAIESGALAPSMDNEFVSVTDKFRFGEFKDLGVTSETGMGVKTNQIFLQLPVNPRRLLAVAKLNDVLKENVPMVYKCESYNSNSYQYRIDSAELILSGVMPSSVSGEVCAFFTSNLSRQITETNVLDAYESSKHKINVSGKMVKSLKFSTGTLFINDDPTSPMAPDPSLCYAGLLVVFVRSPVVASQGVASSTSGDPPDFSYLGPMVQAQMKMKCSYKGFEYAPQNVDSRSLGNTYDQDLFTTHIVTSQIVINSDDTVSCLPTFFVPPEMQSDVLTTAYAQTYGGEWLGSTGSQTKPLFNMKLHNVPPYLTTKATIIPGVIGSVNLFSWSSFTGFVQSAFSKLMALPDQINQRFIDLFGEVAGNALYNISKWVVTAGVSMVTGGILTKQIGAMNSWNSQGFPIDSTGAVCTGYIKAGSVEWNTVYQSFIASGQGAYLNEATAQGVDISFMNVMNLNYFHNDGGAQPYIGSQGRIGAWTKPVYGYTEVKPSFGQPTSIGTTQTRPAPLRISQLASDHTTQRLGATIPTTVSFFGYCASGGTAVKIYPTEATNTAPGIMTPNSVIATVAGMQSYYHFCDYNITPGGYAIQALSGHISIHSSLGASFNSTTGAISPHEVLTVMAAETDGVGNPCDLYFHNLFGSLDFNFILKNEVPAVERSVINTSATGAFYFHFVGLAHTQSHSLALPAYKTRVVQPRLAEHPLKTLGLLTARHISSATVLIDIDFNGPEEPTENPEPSDKKAIRDF